MSRVLLVEDNLDLSELLRDLLVRSGHEVRAVTMAPEALGELGLEPAGACWPELVLLDRHLPGMDGDEILRRLRARPETGALPVVLMSGAGDFPSDPAARGLRKPFEPQRLLDVIKELLP